MTALEYSLSHPTTVVEEVTVEESVTDPGEYVEFCTYWLNGKIISFQDYLKYDGFAKTIRNHW